MSITTSIEKYKDNANVLLLKLLAHAQRQYMAWLFAGVSLFLFHQNYQLGYNRTESLPYKLFVIHKGEQVKVGDKVAFGWDGGGKYAWMSPFKPGSTMVKYVMGKPGDVIRTDQDGEVSLNGMPHAKTKDFTKTGKPLKKLVEPGDSKLIGEHQYYVGTPHPDGFDSRYEMVGLIDAGRFIGKVYAIF